MRTRRESRSTERGAATVIALVLVTALGAVAVGGALVGGVLVGQRRAAAAADLAALAGAEALRAGGGAASVSSTACAAARRVSERNGAQLTGCLADGLEMLIEVEVDVPTVFGGGLKVPGRARAGPGSAVGRGAPAFERRPRGGEPVR